MDLMEEIYLETIINKRLINLLIAQQIASEEKPDEALKEFKSKTDKLINRLNVQVRDSKNLDSLLKDRKRYIERLVEQLLLVKSGEGDIDDEVI